MARHGGGAFSGKDPTKVDRSAAYAARWVAKNVVAAGLATRCEVQLAYAIGVARPVSVTVETFGTETVPIEQIERAITEIFDLRPAAIIRALDLRRPIFQQTAAYGHFGRTDLDVPWERTNKVDELRPPPGVDRRRRYAESLDRDGLRPTRRSGRRWRPLAMGSGSRRRCSITRRAPRRATSTTSRRPRAVARPPGMHTHVVDQIFYILERDDEHRDRGQDLRVPAGPLVVFPAGVPHRNWNGGTEPTVHLAFNTPMPDPNVPFATSMAVDGSARELTPKVFRVDFQPGLDQLAVLDAEDTRSM